MKMQTFKNKIFTIASTLVLFLLVGTPLVWSDAVSSSTKSEAGISQANISQTTQSPSPFVVKTSVKKKKMMMGKCPM
ncbi:MAG: hypothetical protein HY583_01090 [Candidatus Omnitrophica bacterium]|nr:hypothetical protein [Candidatus Omnitrophota bacterium]